MSNTEGNTPRRPGPHGAEARPEPDPLVPAPHGARPKERISNVVKKAKKKVARKGVFQEVCPTPVTAAEAVTAIDETWDEQQGKMVPRKQLESRACFIATAAYGDIDAPEVEQLRRFRDKSLMTNPVGRGFVKAYYRISPPFARLIARKPHLRMAARKVLDVVRRKAAL
ncbi:MAG: CFI-box-CTERM domain-containing protein [Planctomycetota bacterium]|jgi:hypothetical protein